MALACIVAGLGGLMVFNEGKRVKKIEGILVPVEEALEDVERGVIEKKKEGRKEKKGMIGKEKV